MAVSYQHCCKRVVTQSCPYRVPVPRDGSWNTVSEVCHRGSSGFNNTVDVIFRCHLMSKGDCDTEIDSVTCVESSRFALRDLRRNLDAAELHADVIAGDAAREISGLGEFDVVVVDPPRAGLTSQLAEAIAGMNLSRLIYVSCDPSTLARDAAILDSKGLYLRNVKVLDLFPQTYHVEAVAEFSN